jgi:tol-pal system protein YbgF
MFATVFTILFLAPQAHADDMAQLKQQVQALQQSLRSIQQSGIEKGVQSAEGAANIERIRHEFQSLQGSFDAVQFKLQNLQDSLSRYQQDADSRLRVIEEKMDILHKQGGVKSSVLDMGDISSGGEAALYQKGLSQVRDGNYTQAAAGFREFLQKYPKSSFAGNAQYWLAECYYAQKDYQRAIKEYQATITLYPKLDKIPAAKLKQGLAFADLGMTNDAVLFLQKLAKDYPGTPEAMKAQDRIKVLTQTRSLPVPAQRPEDNIPLAPGAIKPKAELAPLPLNQAPRDH